MALHDDLFHPDSPLVNNHWTPISLHVSRTSSALHPVFLDVHLLRRHRLLRYMRYCLSLNGEGAIERVIPGPKSLRASSRDVFQIDLT